ncbi:MAG: alanine racemase [Anaerolineae bacterium]|nr:alanine racemase [Anaerolineae bacterium]MDW7990836.1 alanine racemase [Anaerolineae bacterium]
MGSYRRLDECLSIRDGHLFIEECDTVDLVRRFGSPLFVFSEDQIRRNVRRFKRAFEAGWPDGPVKILPAAKANWITAIQYILADEDCGCDIYSPGELEIALRAEFNPEFISVNGVPKDEDHIYRCVQAGVRITIDSMEELDVIERAAEELNRTAKVRLRLKPAISGFVRHSDFVAEGLVPTDLAAMVYKGGLTKDQVIALGQRILKMERVKLVGFHQHHGRHHRSLRYWEEQMRAFARDLGEVCRALGGFQPQEIDIGGGFAVPRDPFNAATDYAAPVEFAALHAISKTLKPLGDDVRYAVLARLIDTLVSEPNPTPAPSIEEYAEVCTRTLREELPRHGIRTEGLMLQVEPGRAIHGNAGIHLTTVRNIKRITSPIRWTIIVVDTTEFWFTGGRYEHHLHHYIFANKADAPLVDKADIVGRSCYGDRLMPIVRIPEVQVGDILAILDTGAYQEVSMSNFNALPRPAAVLVTGDRAEVIRRRERQEEVFSRDIIPAHLRQARGEERV